MRKLVQEHWITLSKTISLRIDETGIDWWIGIRNPDLWPQKLCSSSAFVCCLWKTEFRREVRLFLLLLPSHTTAAGPKSPCFQSDELAGVDLGSGGKIAKVLSFWTNFSLHSIDRDRPWVTLNAKYLGSDSLSLLFKMCLFGKTWCSWNKCVKNWDNVTSVGAEIINQCQCKCCMCPWLEDV